METTDISISILSNDWGYAKPSDIKTLLQDTASHINRELRLPFTGKIEVKHGESPCTFYRQESKRSEDHPHTIELSATDRHWCQFAYQFAHEFCHVLSDLERLCKSKNKWFHEAICELASAFTLRRMAERWHTNPPFRNWKEYAGSLKKYEEDNMQEYKKEWEEKYGTRPITPTDWLSDYEQEMRDISVKENTNGDPYERYRLIYALVAYALLPIFEQYPSGWNTIRTLPDSNSHIKQYLDDWLKLVGKDNQPFIRLCQERMQSEITPFEI